MSQGNGMCQPASVYDAPMSNRRKDGRTAMHQTRDAPAFSRAPTLSQWDAAALIVGIVVGVGIFRLPSLVAANVDSDGLFLLLWVAGGAVSLVGALVYAELASAFPSAGGEYHFLATAYGRSTGFLFAWARMTVMQTGSIALVAFVFGDYASELLPIGPYGSSLYAAAAIAGLTAVNVFGVRQGKGAQNLLTALIVVAILAAVGAGIGMAPPPAGESGSTGTSVIGAAMIFILLTYGGWNEAAYLSGEIRDAGRSMVRALMIGIGAITGIYLLVNLAYLRVLGLDGMRESQAIGADLLRATFGDAGATLLSIVIGVAALSTLNATIFTGARTNYALGRDFWLLRYLGRWKASGETPANALLVQGGIALGLVALGTALQRGGVEVMVDYTAPVFWFFFLLSGVSLFVLRWRAPQTPRPFRVPVYPVTPLLFCGTCLYMLYSSLAFTGLGAMVGVGVVLAGVPLLLLAERGENRPR
jgi:basic amino acid/polyamine antiporter, APA family